MHASETTARGLQERARDCSSRSQNGIFLPRSSELTRSMKVHTGGSGGLVCVRSSPQSTFSQARTPYPQHLRLSEEVRGCVLSLGSVSTPLWEEDSHKSGKVFLPSLPVSSEGVGRRSPKRESPDHSCPGHRVLQVRCQEVPSILMEHQEFHHICGLLPAKSIHFLPFT